MLSRCGKGGAPRLHEVGGGIEDKALPAVTVLASPNDVAT